MRKQIIPLIAIGIGVLTKFESLWSLLNLIVGDKVEEEASKIIQDGLVGLSVPIMLGVLGWLYVNLRVKLRATNIELAEAKSDFLSTLEKQAELVDLQAEYVEMNYKINLRIAELIDQSVVERFKEFLSQTAAGKGKIQLGKVLKKEEFEELVERRKEALLVKEKIDKLKESLVGKHEPSQP